MTKLLTFSLCAAACLALSACAISITHAGDSSGKHSGNLHSSKFECVSSESGNCHYVLFTSRCSADAGEAGKQAVSCTHQVFDEFKLGVGQTREVRNLPAGYKQCMLPNAMPDVPSCAMR